MADMTVQHSLHQISRNSKEPQSIYVQEKTKRIYENVWKTVLTLKRDTENTNIIVVDELILLFL